MCAASHHVAEGSVTSVSWSGVFAGAAGATGVIDVDVAVLCPAVVGVVVELCGSGRFGSALVAATICGAWP